MYDETRLLPYTAAAGLLPTAGNLRFNRAIARSDESRGEKHGVSATA
jgi:hypothetical protein